MLSATEFTVDTFGNATPLSLVLPRNKHEAAAIIGSVEGAPAAVFLSGNFTFSCFKSAGNHHWRGLIVPNVRVEVDETSIFDPDYDGVPLGSIVRSDTRLIIRAQAEHTFGQATAITLHQDLAPTGDFKAAFGQWQVVIGEGVERRVLWRTPTPNGETS